MNVYQKPPYKVSRIETISKSLNDGTKQVAMYGDALFKLSSETPEVIFCLAMSVVFGHIGNTALFE